MLDDFQKAFRLRITYKTNSFIWALKSIPLIKSLLPASLYKSAGLKRFGTVVGVLIELFTAFSGKALLLYMAFILAATRPNEQGAVFSHLMLFFTLAGGLTNTHLFNPTKDKFYAMNLMRMNARRYVLTEYGYFLLKMFVGYAVFTPLIGALMPLDVLTMVSLPLYVVCVKLIFAVYSLRQFKSQANIYNENHLSPRLWAAVGVLLASAGASLPGVVVPPITLPVLTLALLLPAIFCARYLIAFDGYRAIYHTLLKPENFTGGMSKSAAGAAQQMNMLKKISTDTSLTSDKSGYEYFNDLFIKRHARLLSKSAKRTALIALGLFVAAAVAIFLSPKVRPTVNEMIMTMLPYFLFVMYLINSGKTITQAMFMNCDHSMLFYRFYRQPSAIVRLFSARLQYVILINLLPAAVIAAGLPALLYLSGGTAEALNYVVLFISILSMSVFFSVHNMVLYYLLQPYNVALESKSASFGLANSITYFICYACIRLRVPTLVFGTGVTAFCILYAFAALFLAYRLAPKTFKLRN